MRKFARLLFFLLLTDSLFAADFFSGQAGLMANFKNMNNFGFEPALNFDGFLAGQLALSNAFSIRGEFSIQTGDLFENGLMKEDNSAVFRIDEISATFTKSFAGVNHSISLFKGFFESIGSCQFIGRHLGVKNYSSFLTKNYLGLNGLNVYNVYGNGLSYTLTSKRLPMAFGFILSDNYESPEPDARSQVNFDLRYAVTCPALTMESLAGLGAPLYNKDDNGKDVVLLIETFYFHTGVNLLLLNPYSPLSFLIQGGFEYLPLKKTDRSKTFSKDELFLLFETRINPGLAKCYISLFHFPEDKRKKLVFADDAMGINLRIFGEKLHTETREYDIGVNLTGGLKTSHFSDLTDLDFKKEMDFTVTPFTELDLNGGRFTLALQVGITKFVDDDEGGLKLHVGYKKDI